VADPAGSQPSAWQNIQHLSQARGVVIHTIGCDLWDFEPAASVVLGVVN
jgi:hypothetical protein